MAGKKPLGLITFDIDDTLYATSDFVRIARENSLKAMLAAGLNIDIKTLRDELNEVIAEFTSNDGNHFDRLLWRLPPSALNGVNPAILVGAGVAAYHDAVHNNLQPYEDVLEGVKRLKEQGYRLGIISQGITVKQAVKLVRLRVLPYLDRQAIFISDQTGISKANPKLYSSAAQRVNVSCNECLHIGDRPDRDIDPANSAGWVTILNRRSGRYHERPGATPPAHTIHNFWDLLELMEREYKPASAGGMPA